MPRPGWYNDNVNRAFPLLSTSTGVPYVVSQYIVAATDASPIVITSESHGLQDGYEVVISGALGNTAANGTWIVTRIDKNSFSLNTSTGNGAYGGDGLWKLTGPPTMKNLPDYYIADCGFTLGGSVTYPLPTVGVLPKIENTEAAVYLKTVSRAGNTISFEFRCTDPQLRDDYPLTFTRNITTDTEYDLEYLDSDSPDNPDNSSQSVPVACQLPFWSGYLVTGDVSLIAADLDDGVSVTAPDWALYTNDGSDAQEGVVEPSVVQNLARSIVAGVNIANDDRTRSTPPTDCDPYEWPFEIGLTRVMDQCLTGDVRFKSGFNMGIISDLGTNTITFSTAPNAGAGQPCNLETKLFPSEAGPTNTIWSNNLLEGGPTCKEVARSFNSIGGPLLHFVGGQGVNIIPKPNENKVTIDISMIDMDLCQDSTYSVG